MIINGTTYHDETPIEIVNILEAARLSRVDGNGYRLRFRWGDTETGRDWGDAYHDTYRVEGYVGRRGGTSKIPLLIWNSRSYGGGAILDHCIVKIVTARGKRVLYQHPTYHKEV